MDNRLFNVNGSGVDLLLQTLKLAFMQSGHSHCKAWSSSHEHGLILHWHSSDKVNKLPAPMTAEDCVSFVKNWLNTDFAKQVVPSKWCNDMDHDGSNSLGWQVYCEDWGHVGNHSSAICGIKPAYMWHGK